MTDTLVGVSPLRKAGKKTLTPEEAERARCVSWSRPLALGVRT